jgi:hypothetical protein
MDSRIGDNNVCEIKVGRTWKVWQPMSWRIDAMGDAVCETFKMRSRSKMLKGFHVDPIL